MKNVIMITTDQQQADALGCANPSYSTPHLDRLAQLGVRFTGAISTSAQCSPSRASWLTGKFPHQVGVYQIGHVLDAEEWGMAKAFSEAGYETIYLGKWHLGLSPADHAFARTDYRADGLKLNGANEDPRYSSHKDALATAKALNYLDDYAGKRPFFMHLSWYMPHPNAPADGPFECIETYKEGFPLHAMPVPESYYRDDLSSKPSFQRERASAGESRLTEELIRRDAQRYRTMLRQMDEHLGMLLDKLEHKGMLEETVILFTSDHGDMQGAHRLRLKGVLPYKELYNVPLILYVPHCKFNRKVVPDLVSSSAVPGTLLDAAGISVPAACEGGSLLPLLERSSPELGRHVFFEHYKAYWGKHPLIGVQTEQWKYVRYLEDEQDEMYALAEDPQELLNVAGNPLYEAKRLELKRMVEQWWQSTGALTRAAIEDPLNPWGREG